MYKKLSLFFLLTVIITISPRSFAKYNGDYLNKISTEYVTPHHDWCKNSAGKKLKTLFIVPRWAAREAVELLQRMPMDYREFVTYDHLVYFKETMYESPIEGTSAYEKKAELLEKLKEDYDLIIIGNFLFTALPEEAQFKILMKVSEGTGLLMVSPSQVRRLPYKKVYENPLTVPDFADNKTFSAWQLGKGRVTALSYRTQNRNDLSLTPYIKYSHAWTVEYENAMAFLARSARWTANRDFKVSFHCPELASEPKIDSNGKEFQLQITNGDKVFFRIRDIDNKIVIQQETANGSIKIPALPAGQYFCDILIQENGKNKDFGYYRFQVSSPLGKLTLNAPEVVNDRKDFDGEFKMEKISKEPLKLVIELMDSPYNRIWYRDSMEIPAGKQEVRWQISKYFFPTLAGYVRAKIYNSIGQELAWTEQTVFFPDYRVPGYMQMGWDVLPETTGALYQAQLIDNFGWNLGLTHPRQEGENARITALLNQRFVPYMVRINLLKSKANAVKQQWWHFLPKELKEKVKELNEDENFYRPEVRELWRAGIAHRIKNLPKYSPVIYNLGDENNFSADGAYGPSDEKYFREFVKWKYKDIAALNREWHTDYKNFDEVPHLPLQEAKSSGNFAAWYDHRQYTEKMYADLHNFCSEEIKKYDPRAKVGAEGSVPGELEQTIEKLEFWGPYSNLVEDEALRSFGGDRIRMLWWGGYISSHGGRGKYPQPLLGDMLKGTINGSAWFSAAVNGSMTGFAVDYSPAQYLKGYVPWLDRMRWGEADLLINTPLINSGIMIYWSHASTAARLLDERCSNPNDSISPLIRYCYMRGIGFEFVSSRTLERMKNGKLLFLCGSSALNETETKAINDFVNNGGIVIADINPAILNGYLRPLDSNPLKNLFGNIVFNKVENPQLKPINVTADFNGQNISFQASKAITVPDKPNFEARKVGKGMAVLLNFSLATAENTADAKSPFAGFMDRIMAGASIMTPYQLKDAERYMIMRIRSSKDYDLAGVIVPVEKVGTALQMKLPGERYVYECSKGFIVKDKQITMDFKETPYLLYAIFKEQQKAPEITLAAKNVERGKAVMLKLDKLASKRVYCVRLFDTDGNELLNRNQVIDTSKSLRELPIHLAYTDKPGNWKITVQDITTGLISNLEFIVK